MQFPDELKRLVERFKEHDQSYTSDRYGETSLRDDFLEPLFRNLGWDLNNSAGYAEAYRDVVKEETLRTEDGVKAPDFTFRIGGTRKFFVEAKRPSVKLQTASAAARQIRRYAWSAKLPLSILTNFAEFAVYDTRIKPDAADAAAKARVFLCKVDDYEEKWEWIYSVFSKESILRGSFDKYVENNRSKRGTTEVDEEFLKTIEQC